MISRLDVAVDRRRRARPVWRETLCGQHAALESESGRQQLWGSGEVHRVVSESVNVLCLIWCQGRKGLEKEDSGDRNSRQPPRQARITPVIAK